MRPLIALLLLAVVALAGAQGSAGGYGQGGGGGFGGASMGGFRGGEVNLASTHPEDDTGYGTVYETKTAILTPGDRVEYKITVRKGQALFAGGTSDAFDPALAVEDASGKTLVKNDDREEGDQAPFVAYRFPEAGTYILKVLSYKQAAGGKFTLKLRTFTPVDVAPGMKVQEADRDMRDLSERTVLRIASRKGAIYDVKALLGILAGGGRQFAGNPINIVGPTGVLRNDLKIVPTGGDDTLFQALADGDYFVEFRDARFPRLLADIREVRVVSTTASGTVSFDLDPGEVRIVEFPVKPEEIVRTTLAGRGLFPTLSAPAGEANVPNDQEVAYGNSPAWVWFRLQTYSEDDVVRVFRGEGTARLALQSSVHERQTVTVTNSGTLPTWPSGEALRGTLAIGESKLFLLPATRSELMRVSAKSPTFLARLDLFRLNGERANSLLDRQTHVAADDLYFPEAGLFLARLSCEGNGGSGEFTLRRDVPAPLPYALGKTQTLTLDGTNFGLYAVDLEAGKRYQLTTDEPAGTALRADLLDEDGTFLRSQAIRFDKVTVQYFVPTRSGRHRLWLRGPGGTRHFRLEPNVPPSLGGG